MDKEILDYLESIDNIMIAFVGRGNYERIKAEGLLHDRDLRNIKIRSMFNELRKEKTMTVENACNIISQCPFFSPSGEKYFISAGRIENIVYKVVNPAPKFSVGLKQ